MQVDFAKEACVYSVLDAMPDLSVRSSYCSPVVTWYWKVNEALSSFNHKYSDSVRPPYLPQSKPKRQMVSRINTY